MLRYTLLRGLSGLALLAIAGPATAQLSDGTAITLVMPYPPGGLGDFLARLVARKMAEQSGISMVVENRAGANEAIGAAAVAQARPDGRTLLCVPASTFTTNPAGMSADSAAKLSESLQRIAREPDFVKALTERGGVIVGGGPDNLRAAIQAEAEKTGKLIKELGISAQ